MLAFSHTCLVCVLVAVLGTVGTSVDTIRTSNDGGFLVGSSEDCSGSGSSVSCTGEASWAVASADDCSCVTCGSNGDASFGSCAVPVDLNWISEGVCSLIDKDEYCVG